MAQWLFVEWLLFWIRESREFVFEWDPGNRSKSETKHGITSEEAEAVFRSGLALPLGVQVQPITDEQRLGLIGPSLQSGRLLQVAFVLRNEKVRVISARVAKKKERKRYEEILREIAKSL